MATLHMICGLPGSGKTTLAKQLEAELPALRMAPDEWLARIIGNGYDRARREVVEAIQMEIAVNALRLGIDVIVENGFWLRSEREAIRLTAKNAGASVKLYYLDVPRDELLARLRKRNDSLPPNTFRVDEAQVDLWSKWIEPPTPDEFEC